MVPLRITVSKLAMLQPIALRVAAVATGCSIDGDGAGRGSAPTRRWFGIGNDVRQRLAQTVDVARVHQRAAEPRIDLEDRDLALGRELVVHAAGPRVAQWFEKAADLGQRSVARRHGDGRAEVRN